MELIEITNLKQLKKLAPWYKQEKYDVFENAPLNYVVDAIQIRTSIKNSFERHITNDGEPSDWIKANATNISEWLSILPQTESDSNYDWEDYNISEIFEGDYIGDEGLEQELESLSDEDYVKFKSTHKEKSVFLEVNLERATNDDLVFEFKRFLNEIRKRPNYIDEPKRNRKIMKQIETLHVEGVWSFIDIELWAKIYGYKFTDDFLVDAVFSYYEDENQHTFKTISDKLRNYHAPKVLSNEFSEQLLNYIKTKNINKVSNVDS